MSYYQRTLKRAITCTGIGLHSGRRVTMSLKPAPAGHGLRFVRTDLNGADCPALIERVSETSFATILKNGEAEIRTTEHLLAALHVLAIDNLVIELDAAEVPIMDGSAAPFIYLVLEAGVVEQPSPRRWWKVAKPFEVALEGKRVALAPLEGDRPRLEVDCRIAFDHPLIGRQRWSGEVTEKRFARELAPARTFTFLKDVEALRRRGLALGGSLENAVVLGDNKFLNPHLRFKDEFVRHKAMDAIGDFLLLGRPLWGRLELEKAGHAAHAYAMRAALEAGCLEPASAPIPAVAPRPAWQPAAARV